MLPSPARPRAAHSAQQVNARMLDRRRALTQPRWDARTPQAASAHTPLKKGVRTAKSVLTARTPIARARGTVRARRTRNARMHAGPIALMRADGAARIWASTGRRTGPVCDPGTRWSLPDCRREVVLPRSVSLPMHRDGQRCERA